MKYFTLRCDEGFLSVKHKLDGFLRWMPICEIEKFRHDSRRSLQ